jgi:hypothetical protein
MNYADDDYAMGHILRFARGSGCDTLTIDFATGKGGPPELLRDPISDLPARYTKFFWDLVRKHGSERHLIAAATLTLKYDLSVQRPLRGSADVSESPYICEVLITDDRGKNYEAQFRSWWYPERNKVAKAKKSWWKFWVR